MNERRQCGLADGRVIWQEFDGVMWREVAAPAADAPADEAPKPRRGRRARAAA